MDDLLNAFGFDIERKPVYVALCYHEDFENVARVLFPEQLRYCQ